MEGANAFLREHYIAEFNRRFAKPAEVKERRSGSADAKNLDLVFSVQTEPAVGQDNTVVLQNRCLQLDKTRSRNTVAGCTVTICEHLDGCLSVHWRPHLFTAMKAETDDISGALEISPTTRDSHFAHRPTATTRVHSSPRQTQIGLAGQIRKLTTASCIVLLRTSDKEEVDILVRKS